MAKAKATPKAKITSNMAPEGGTTYDYANPNYNPGEVDPNHDWTYRGPSAIERGLADAIEKRLVWKDGNPETNTSGGWVRKEQ